ncbi:MAG TPA: hypothetical protein VGS22_11045 [Thermoanaerobaculia bacterium]|jgi:hypothetical protein|nr:hypothetical protein [Thermoanaerobaculia bacterium]
MPLPPPPLQIPLLKGALVSIDDTTQQTQVIAFQYNPSSMRRQLDPFTVGGQPGDRTEAPRYAGAPAETISLQVQIDASDQLAAGNTVAQGYGILPQLAALELLIYPTSTQVIQNETLLATGAIEIVPMTAPRTLFVWGPNRVLPVRVQSYEVTEELFDPTLNPLRATANLSLRVLSYSDLAPSDPDYHQFLAYQQELERLAPLAETSLSSASTVTGVDPTQL